MLSGVWWLKNATFWREFEGKNELVAGSLLLMVVSGGR